MDSGFESLVIRSLAGPLIGWVLASVLLVAPLILYVIARWRAHRDPVADPQLGIKLALHYFMLLGFQIALFGAVMLIYAVISSEPSEAKGASFRTALALVMPGGLVYGVHLGVLRRTNDAAFPQIRRLVAGYNLVLTGIAGAISLVLAFQALFQRGSSGELGRLAAAMLVVYGAAWVFVGWQVMQHVLGPPGPGNVVSPPDAPSQSSQPQQPGLPQLGSGAFPPLDHK
jgi:hypothetical protein